jgi:hypothetical protein
MQCPERAAAASCKKMFAHFFLFVFPRAHTTAEEFNSAGPACFQGSGDCANDGQETSRQSRAGLRKANALEHAEQASARMCIGYGWPVRPVVRAI